jgi:hypothetical protein
MSPSALVDKSVLCDLATGFQGSILESDTSLGVLHTLA